MSTYKPRLKATYTEKVVPALQKEFNYKSSMQVPRITKIAVNQGLGSAVGDTKIVENAIKYGISQMLEPGRVIISARREEALLCILIEDSAGLYQPLPSGDGLGMNLVDRRIKLRYGDAYGIGSYCHEPRLVSPYALQKSAIHPFTPDDFDEAREATDILLPALKGR